MKSTLKTLICITSLGFVIVALLAGYARSATDAERAARLTVSLDSAMRAALYGVEANCLRVNGHLFRIDTAHIAHSGSLTIIKGRLAHRRLAGGDELVHYTIRKNGPVVLSADMTVVSGRPSARTSTIAKYVVGVTVPEEELASASLRLARLTDGNWETTAELVVTSIALRADRFGRDRLALLRANSSRATDAKSNADREPVGARRIPLGNRDSRDRS